MRPLALPFLVALVLTSASSAFAQWEPDGVPVTTISWGQAGAKIVPDGAGGSIVAWNDLRNGGDIYVQRLNPSGVPMWGADGVALTGSPSAFRSFPEITADGAGGVILAWSDQRNGTPDIYVQRVNAAGVPQWTPGGVVVCAAASLQEAQKIVSDGAGGAFVAWEDYRSSTFFDIYVRRVNASGVPQGPADGVALTFPPGDNANPTMIADGLGGAIVTWEDAQPASADIYAQRVSALGTASWTPGGVPICAAAFDQDTPVLVSDGAGGAIIIWWDKRNGEFNGDIYAQRVDGGVVQWMPDGVPICTDLSDQGSLGLQGSPTIALDGVGGAIIAWGDMRDGNGDIYAQHVSAAGTTFWKRDGIALTSAGFMTNPRSIPDGMGGAIVGWLVTYDFGFDYLAQRVSSEGVPQYDVGGIRLTRPVNELDLLDLSEDGGHGALVAWSDGRNGPHSVFASIINGNTPTGTNVTVIPVDPTTGHSPVTLTFDSVNGGSTSLVTGPTGPPLPGSFSPGDGTYYNLSSTATFYGNVTVCVTYNPATLAVPEASVRLLHFDLQAGWVDITTSLDMSLHQVCGVTQSLSPFVIGGGTVTGVGDGAAPTRFALHQNVPNPFGATTAIDFDVPRSGGNVRIEIYDVAGKKVRSIVDRTFDAGVHHASWDGRDESGKVSAPGVYYYRIAAGAFHQTMRMVRLK